MCPGAQVPMCQAHQVPRCQVPRCPGAHVPGERRILCTPMLLILLSQCPDDSQAESCERLTLTYDLVPYTFGACVCPFLNSLMLLRQLLHWIPLNIHCHCMARRISNIGVQRPY